MADSFDVKQAVRLAVALGPSVCDEAAIRAILGDHAVATLAEVASAFGVKETTVRNTWRRGETGMPGTATRGGRGQFPLAECLIWYLKTREAASAGRGKTEYTERKQIADAIAAEIDAQRKEFELKKARGEFIEAVLVRAELASVLSAFRDNVMAIPQKLKPMLPAKVADDVALDTERYLASALESLADKLEVMAPVTEEADDED